MKRIVQQNPQNVNPSKANSAERLAWIRTFLAQADHSATVVAEIKADPNYDPASRVVKMAERDSLATKARVIGNELTWNKEE